MGAGDPGHFEKVGFTCCCYETLHTVVNRGGGRAVRDQDPDFLLRYHKEPHQTHTGTH